MKELELTEIFDPVLHSKRSELAIAQFNKELESVINERNELEFRIHRYLMTCKGLKYSFESAGDELFVAFGGYNEFINRSLKLSMSIDDETEENEQFINLFSSLIFSYNTRYVELRNVRNDGDYVAWSYYFDDEITKLNIRISIPKNYIIYNVNKNYHHIIISINENWYYDGGYDWFNIKDKLLKILRNPQELPEDDITFENIEEYLIDFNSIVDLRDKYNEHMRYIIFKRY